MKIAYIIDSMSNAAGRERVVSNKATYLTRMGHRVSIITTDQRQRPYYYPLPPEVTCEDWAINYSDYAGQGMIAKLRAFRQKEKLFEEKLLAYVEENKPDVLVAVMDRYLPALTKAGHDCATVYEHHFHKEAMQDVRDRSSRMGLQKLVYGLKDRLYTRYYYNRVDAFAVLTEEDAQKWGKAYRKKIVMPNSIGYNPARTADPENKIVVAAGRLTYQKGFDRLLSAWKTVEAGYPDWQLRIYGRGEDEAALQQQIEQLKLHNAAILPPTEAIHDRMHEASVFVLSSRFEGLPMILLEAMSEGLCIVSYDCPCGPKDVIRDGKNGLLAKEGDVEALAEALARVIRSADLRKALCRQAKADAARYSHEEIMNRWVETFETLRKK